ncbi:MAG: hypothetical protein H6644_09980 [Caldilineaceae bacterium]|nr:hypothetical protein [Caldilineaceae bacterium]
MSHGDRVERLPDGFHAIARSENSPLAAIADPARGLYGIQFHPEVVHTPQGGALLENFVKRACGCTGDWTPATSSTRRWRRFAHRWATPPRHLQPERRRGQRRLRPWCIAPWATGWPVSLWTTACCKDEATQVIDTFRTHQGMHLVAVDAKEEFLTDLAGITDPEEKRKRIGALHPRLRGGGGAAGPDVGRGFARVPGPGHALSRCHRVGRQR